MQVAAAAFQSERAGSIVPWFRLLFIRFERGRAEDEEFACGQWHYNDVYIYNDILSILSLYR
jgi:hypothetical protein